MPRDHSRPFKFATVGGNPNWKDILDRTKAKCEEFDVDPAPIDDLLEPLDPPVDSDGNPRFRQWTRKDINVVRDKLIEACPDCASTDVPGGTGDGDAPLNKEWFDAVEPDPETGKSKWRRIIWDRLDEAIDFECGCCYTVAGDVNIEFLGNLQPNPQTVFLITPADCEATPEELAEMLSNALVMWLASEMDVISNLEGFSITAVPDSISITLRSASDCPTEFSPPVIES